MVMGVQAQAASEGYVCIHGPTPGQPPQQESAPSHPPVGIDPNGVGKDELAPTFHDPRRATPHPSCHN